MTGKALLLDTVFIHALLNPRDRYHPIAQTFLPHVREAAEVWLTEAILVEVANGLSAINRTGAARFIRQCYHTTNMHIVSVDTALLNRALDLYLARPDKTWGLTDCISFVVMHERQLIEALTADEHFVQAGFRALLLEGS